MLSFNPDPLPDRTGGPSIPPVILPKAAFRSLTGDAILNDQAVLNFFARELGKAAASCFGQSKGGSPRAVQDRLNQAVFDMLSAIFPHPINSLESAQEALSTIEEWTEQRSSKLHAIHPDAVAIKGAVFAINTQLLRPSSCPHEQPEDILKAVAHLLATITPCTLDLNPLIELSSAVTPSAEGPKTILNELEALGETLQKRVKERDLSQEHTALFAAEAIKLTSALVRKTAEHDSTLAGMHVLSTFGAAGVPAMITILNSRKIEAAQECERTGSEQPLADHNRVLSLTMPVMATIGDGAKLAVEFLLEHAKDNSLEINLRRTALACALSIVARPASKAHACALEEGSPSPHRELRTINDPRVLDVARSLSDNPRFRSSLAGYVIPADPRN